MDQFGDGLGEGQGAGYRPEQETDTGFYESQVGGKPKQGEAVRLGDAGGANKAGVTRESAREQILSEVQTDDDPLMEERLPKSQREHVREYIKRLNEGQ